MKTIIVKLEVEVPDEATEKDITDFVDVEYGECGSMKLDNPCQGGATEVVWHEWKFQ
ncbi:TPA: hypothetical protein ACQ8UR_003906 [Escherichia coli]|nr:hypothetical protein [Escherichia coli]